MRQPTPISRLYAWHRAALAGDRPETFEGDVQCGWFRTRLVRGGPWVPARIWIDRDIDLTTGELTRDEEYRAEVGGEPRNPLYVWDSVNGNPISKERYDALCELRAQTPAMLATHVPYQSERAMRP